MTYTLPVPEKDFYPADIERFTALSIRRGSPLPSLGKEGALDTVLAAAVLELEPGAPVEKAEVDAVLGRFLAGPGAWLRTSAGELFEMAVSRAFLEAVPEGRFSSRVRAFQGATAGRLIDEIEAAEAILARKRAEHRAWASEKNRRVHARPPEVDDEADRQWMEEALAEARLALAAGEVPVGAVLVREGRVLSRSGNRTLRDHDPTAHAEVLVLRESARLSGNHRLPGATLYVTLEPCPMCAGAISEARVGRVVFGAPDPGRGALGSALSLFDIPGVNHRAFVTGGVLAGECGGLVKAFFAQKRSPKKPEEPL